MGRKGRAARFAAIKHAAGISWEPFNSSKEPSIIEVIACCNTYVWAIDNDTYVVLRKTKDGPEMAARGAWEEARPVWDILVLAHEQHHEILSQYGVPKMSHSAETTWIPFVPAGTVRIRETSCCGIYEWASQGGLFFVLQRTADGLLETARGQYRFARQKWDHLLEEHRKTHLPMVRKVGAQKRGRVKDTTSEAAE
ncbi:hypothetical protein [Nonomuraea sp. NPDC023979]|uniref:hypothetical protein n=1 Tax=Nonomuraea sp. NPDC023979 TaxID=3154796 RepID=UPI0033C49383